jgi:kojibiose phosphorylase
MGADLTEARLETPEQECQVPRRARVSGKPSDAHFAGRSEFHVEQSQWTAATNKAWEGLFAQGNGYLHVRGCFEEGLVDAPQNERYVRSMTSVTTEIPRNPLSKFGTFIPGIVGDNPGLGEVMVNLPYFMDLAVVADSERFDMAHSTIEEFRRELDLRTGVLRREVVWVTHSGCRVALHFERFASWANKHLFFQRVSVEVLTGNPVIEWFAGVDGDVTTNGERHLRHLAIAERDGAVLCSFETDLGVGGALCSRLTADPAPHAPVGFIPGPASGRQTFAWSAKSGETMTVTKVTAVASGPGSAAEREQHVLAVSRAGMSLGWDGALAASACEALRAWEGADLRIDGNPKVQLLLRWAIYHLVRCTPAESGTAQVCAKGFAGEAYYGRYFWDSEIYLLPFYLHTNPAAARGLLLYRYNTLDGARANAREYGCRGAKYAWQSGVDGTEQCSLWEYADNELHVTADVAFGIVHYLRVTGDLAFVRDYGLEILLETARYWVDRVDRDDDGIPHLINVMGPDEYSPMTRDNAFTNRLAAFNCHQAAELAHVVAAEYPQEYARLAERMALEPQELADFEDLAASIPIPYDPERNLVLQSEDFEDYADIDIDRLWTDKSKAFGFSVTQEKLYRSKCIKQADVIALMGLFPEEFTDTQVRAAYEYYKPFTVHDSSLSAAMHALVAARLGEEADVAALIDKALAVDFDPESGGAGEGIHIANCACLWQLFALGAAPSLPSHS